MGHGLPHPATVGDEYLAAVLAVLNDIRDRLPDPAAVVGQPEPGDGPHAMELAEPAQPPVEAPERPSILAKPTPRQARRKH